MESTKIKTRGPAGFPTIKNAGVDGALVSFGSVLSEPANRAAIGFRHAIEAESWEGVEETSSSLVSTYIRFDIAHTAFPEIEVKLRELFSQKNWYEEPLPRNRKHWRIPTVLGTRMAPQLEEAAKLAGMTVKEAKRSLTSAQLRVYNIGFAPGQPYIGELGPEWDIPRQSNLTSSIPVGALAVAIRQLVLFPVVSPTGWRHVAQTAFRTFRPDEKDPFILRPGDEISLEPVEPDVLVQMQRGKDGGARQEVVI